MNLFMLNDTESSGAVCLDGTPSGFYFSPATNASNANDWQIYFQGGGWCYDKMDCWTRSSTNLGSSKAWKKTGSMDGLLSSDCSQNPDFCNFNRVWMVYCDGNSFSGNREEPVVVNEKPLYFRGRRIIDETLSALKANFGLGNAENVMLTGCSAGGLATYLHTDYVHDQLKVIAPSMKKYKASPISGFFLQHQTVEGKDVYPTQMKEIFNLANSTHGLNDDCIASFAPDDQWKCNFAQHAYAHTKAMTFPLNSALDSWQTGCIYTSELPPNFPNQTGSENGLCSAAPGWKPCASNPENCNQTEIKAMNQYITDFDSIMTEDGSATYSKDGNGAFIHSCHTHCEAQGGAFFKFAVNGITMQQAVSKWWNSDSEPSSSHTYSPCFYKDGTSGPRKCNPTC
jgi:hypothetical protein